jgi:hypothetical protein
MGGLEERFELGKPIGAGGVGIVHEGWAAWRFRQYGITGSYIEPQTSPSCA